MSIESIRHRAAEEHLQRSWIIADTILLNNKLKKMEVKEKLELKEGQLIYAINNCVMEDGRDKGKESLKIGKGYPICFIDEQRLCVIDESNENHYFPFGDFHRYFSLFPIGGSEKNKENYKKGEHPTYYVGKYKGIKAIDVIHDYELTHCKASALEYILRSGKKDDEIEDLRKAINHLQMEIKHLEEIKK